MARTTRDRAGKATGASRTFVSVPVTEYRIETPRSDLAVLKAGERFVKLQTPTEEWASGIVAKMARAMAKPGLTRANIFQSGSHKVYAYSAYSQDPSKVVREDASGHKILGRFAGGRFRPLRSGKSF